MNALIQMLRQQGHAAREDLAVARDQHEVWLHQLAVTRERLREARENCAAARQRSAQRRAAERGKTTGL